MFLSAIPACSSSCSPHSVSLHQAKSASQLSRQRKLNSQTASLECSWFLFFFAWWQNPSVDLGLTRGSPCLSPSTLGSYKPSRPRPWRLQWPKRYPGTQQEEGTCVSMRLGNNWACGWHFCLWGKSSGVLTLDPPKSSMECNGNSTCLLSTRLEIPDCAYGLMELAAEPEWEWYKNRPCFLGRTT